MTAKVKFVQLASTPDSDKSFFYALDDRGRVWDYGEDGFTLLATPDEPKEQA